MTAPNLSFVVKNGVHIRFWQDAWLPGERDLGSSVHHSIPLGEENFPVASYARDGEWRWEILKRILPDHICKKMASIRAPSLGEEDQICWALSAYGIFSLKTAYSSLAATTDPRVQQDPLFSLVWRWGGPQRIKSFLWKLAHGKLLTNDECLRRSMCEDTTCSRCDYLDETITHCLRDCEEVRELSEKVIHPNHYAKFFSLGLHE